MYRDPPELHDVSFAGDCLGHVANGLMLVGTSHSQSRTRNRRQLALGLAAGSSSHPPMARGHLPSIALPEANGLQTDC